MTTAERIAVGSLDSLIERAKTAERAGDWSDALQHYEAAFSLLPAQGDARRTTELLRWIGAVHRQRGDIELANDLYMASLEIANLNGMIDQAAYSVNCLAIVDQTAGRPDQAEKQYRKARELAEQAGDERLVAMIDQNLGSLANIRGDMKTALRNYRSALSRYEVLDDYRAAMGTLNNMGMAHVDLGQYELAEQCFDKAYELAGSNEDAHTLARIQVNRAELYLKRQQYEHARQSCDDAFAIYSRLGAKSGLGEAYKFYGIFYRETGKSHLADIHLDLALKLAESAQNPLLQAEVTHELARVHMEERRNRDAISCLNRAHRLFNQMQARREVRDVESQMRELETSYLRVVEQWGSETLESADPWMLGHARRVASYTETLASAMGVSGRALTWFKVGAFLHDVGKTVVPESVLTKAGKLNEAEWEMMRRHTTAGDDIVASLEFPFNVRSMVRSHHERWDGKGYPDKLARRDIPLPARIIAVADVYDALTSNRSYRQAFSHEAAHRILDEEAGSSLDPKLVSLFQRVAPEPISA
jgi:putative nucleotidyltransferase with HDIG domain